MMKTIFETHGLTVTGTDEQIKNYAEDEHAYDYIKGTIGHMVKYVEKYAKDDVTIRYARVKNQKRLAFANRNEKHIDTTTKLPTEVGNKTKIFIHNSKTNTFEDIISIDDLSMMKMQDYMETAAYMLDMPMNDAINKELRESIVKLYNEKNTKEDEGKKEEYKPKPFSNMAQSITSEHGFYVGDPALVLKDEILNKGVREGRKIQTGLYDVNGQNMAIIPSINGCHGGHDIYSNTIGIVPLELVDKKKIKQLPADSLDIRIGSNINFMMKQNKLYLAQGSIDEIDVTTQDEQAVSADFNMQL